MRAAEMLACVCFGMGFLTLVLSHLPLAEMYDAILRIASALSSIA